MVVVVVVVVVVMVVVVGEGGGDCQAPLPPLPLPCPHIATGSRCFETNNVASTLLLIPLVGGCLELLQRDALGGSTSYQVRVPPSRSRSSESSHVVSFWLRPIYQAVPRSMSWRSLKQKSGGGGINHLQGQLQSHVGGMLTVIVEYEPTSQLQLMCL